MSDAVYHSSNKSTWGTPDHILEAVRAMGPIMLDPATDAENRTGARYFCTPEGKVTAGPGYQGWFCPVTRERDTGHHAGDIVNGGWCISNDGLSIDWEFNNGGLVYCNPPYGRGTTGKWAEYARNSGAEVVMLLPCRPATAWWINHVLTAQAIAFHDGRVRFAGATSGAPFPSALAYWGKRPGLFEHHMKKHCWVVRHWTK